MIVNALRSVLIGLDSVVYWFVSILYQLFMIISNATIFDDATMKTFYQRIYVLIGIFMLFKISFSLLSMIANPEKLTDKERGIGKITTRIFISLVMLLSMPTVFELAGTLQTEIIDSHILETVILGVRGDDVSSTQTTIKSEFGSELAYTTFRAFFYPKDQDYQTTGNSTIASSNSNTASLWNKAEQDKEISSLAQIVNEKNNGEYIFEYKFIISTAAGIFVAYILLSFCIDIGVRAVKLAFLQIMAPIPIILYIDPKSSKDGSFNNWVKMITTTYLDIFIRLIIIFFVVFVVGQISSITFAGSNNFILEQFAKVFVIIGALMFAKQAPGLIKDLFGIKGDANAFGDLNPFKKMAKSPFISATVGGIAGIGAGAVGNFMASRQAGRNMFQSLGSGLGGAFSGGTRGLVAGLGDQNHNGLSAGLRAGGVGGQHILNNQGTTFLGRTAARAQTAVGMQTLAQRQDKVVEAYDKYANLRKSIKETAEGNKTKRMFFDNGQGGYISFAMNADGSVSSAAQAYMNANHVAPGQVLSADDFKEHLQRAVDSGASETEIQARKDAYDNAVNAVIDEDVQNASTSIGAMYQESLRVINENSDDAVFANMSTDASASALGTNFAAAKEATTVLKSSEEYQRAHRTQSAVSGNNNNKK